MVRVLALGAAAIALALIGVSGWQPAASQDEPADSKPKPTDSRRKNHDDELKCGGIWYHSKSCPGDRCTCKGCKGGKDCPCLAVLKKNTGTVRGTIKSPWFKKAPGLVYIKEVKGRKFAMPRVAPKIDQKNLVFRPHILPVLVGTQVFFANNDDVKHNVYSTKSSSVVFNLGTYASGNTKKKKLDKVGTVFLLCNVHAEMSAYIVVCQNPYFALVSRKSRKFQIRNVPAGTYKLAVFHEKQKAKDIEVTVTAGKPSTVKFGKFKRKR